MLKKPAFWISIASTIFILFTFSSLFGALNAQSSQAVDPAVAQSTAQLTEAYAQREAAYQALIDQANQQLAAAQAALNAQTNTSNSAAGSVAFTAEQASAIAQNAASGAQPSGPADLVDFQGSVAYEVPFGAGNIYVDANSGQVLYNGTVSQSPATITADQAAQIAANYMGRSDIYAVDTTTLGGANVYRVKFVNSDAVFVDQYGQIVLVRLASPSPSAQTASRSDGEGEHGDD